ncbi:O-antigen ligase [Chromobacterium alkanivorans]|uniref:O-antigen ligase family protein n=1 Tax=Chromobacterium alkanivorans TaxID=1071719 RepID=UPI002169F462|nr:O-antigen ligase family protein [Chromobacterium alkanivorans]MCS3802867.1 O-antigen ligase [Chromobacterium alkanivorans]MCS3817193.1 O-antigen ligase [Chromobacterium alkanivorans]MCS3872233.1 O-antigen ligase [Chromobacterium alkanivorans]
MNDHLSTEPRWHGRLAVGLSLAFLTLANVSHTIALRYVILLVMLILVAKDYAGLKRHWREQRGPVVAIGAFLLYALLHTLLLSMWPEASASEFRSQLLIGGLWFAAGLALFRAPRGWTISDLVIVAGCVLALVEFGHGAYVYLTAGQWPFDGVFTTATKLEFTFFMNFVLAFIVAAFCFGQRGTQPLTRFPRWSLGLAATLILFVSLKAGARNGMIGLIYLMLSMLLIYTVFEGVKIGWGKTLLIAGLVLAALGSLAVYTIKQDSRNQIFFESATAGWHYADTKAWLRMEPYPVMANGQSVDPSAYERVAWIHSGLDLIAAKPMGYGYSRNAFTNALTATGHPNQVGHSHSGFIDLGVGLGVVGIALWLAFCGVLIWTGYQAFRLRRDTLGLVLMLVSCGFLGRMLLESVNKDHMLHIFLFTAAALLAELRQREKGAAHE